MKQASLLFLIKDEKILLAMKKRGFGEGRWNGVGGKPNKNEPIRDTAIRECQEEIGVTPVSIKKVAKLNFFFPMTKSDWNQQVVVFICSEWTGQPVETEEMAPQWFNNRNIPYEEMWSDDKFWLPQVVAGEYITAEFHFDDKDNLL